MATHRDYIGAMQGHLLKLEEGRAAIAADKRYSVEHKARLMADHEEDLRGKLAWDVGKLFGTLNEEGELTGGLLWAEKDAASEQLQKAIDTGDGMDPMRLQNAMLSLPARIKGFSELGDFSEWYDREASVYDRRAAQLLGRDELQKRWSANDGLGSVYARLEADDKAARMTPARVAAEERRAAVDRDIDQARQFVQIIASRMPEADFKATLNRVQWSGGQWQRTNPDRILQAEPWRSDDWAVPSGPGDDIIRQFETVGERLERVYRGQ